MTNELKIRPLLAYEVFVNNEGHVEKEVFTADDQDLSPNGDSLKFYRAGTVIREYLNPMTHVRKVVSTPADEYKFA